MATTIEARRKRAGGLMTRQVASIAAAVIIAGMATSAAAFEGFSSNEKAALNVRHLQSELMVAALSCDLRPQYNAAIDRFQDEWVSHGQELKQLFRRTYAGGGERELNRFVTALANEASAESLSRGGGYCRDARSLFTEILALPRRSLAVFWDGRADISQEHLPGRIESAAAPRN